MIPQNSWNLELLCYELMNWIQIITLLQALNKIQLLHSQQEKATWKATYNYDQSAACLVDNLSDPSGTSSEQALAPEHKWYGRRKANNMVKFRRNEAFNADMLTIIRALLRGSPEDPSEWLLPSDVKRNNSNWPFADRCSRSQSSRISTLTSLKHWTKFFECFFALGTWKFEI